VNIVSSGGRLQIYGDDVSTFKLLPAGFFDVCFSKHTGFYLSPRAELTVGEEKIYGDLPAKTEKILKSYALSGRNLGVLLSGPKGVGKSMLVRLLGQRVHQQGDPVLVVSSATPGLADFLSSIHQNCMVLFDEFEKVFASTDDYNPQNELLPLFDGLDGGHKLFVITCNELNKVSSYMLNRPGRFHYHFSLQAPTDEEIRQYLQDQLLPQYQEAIESVVRLGHVADMPYDFLRAIVFELNQGYSLQQTMQDLNITRADLTRFDITVYLGIGETLETWSEVVDLTRRYPLWIEARSLRGNRCASISFIPSLIKVENGEYVVTEHIAGPNFDESDFMELPEEKREKTAEKANRAGVAKIVLKKVQESGPIRFMV